MSDVSEELTIATPPEEVPQFVASIAHLVIVLVVVIAVIVLQFVFVVPRMSAPESAQERLAHSRSLFYAINIAAEWAILLLIWFGLRRRGNRMRDLIGGSWSSWQAVGVDLGLALGLWILLLTVSFSASYFLAKIGYQRAPNYAVQRMLPADRFEIILWIFLSLSAGLMEEVLFRGYLQRQFHALSGSQAAALLLQAALFGIGHVYQGALACFIITIYGLLFGGLALRRNSLRPGIVAHAWMDISLVIFVLWVQSRG
jgi:uncharacterized protein